MIDSLAHACRFCSLSRSTHERASVDEPWLQTADYVAIASIGALVPGWSLILPKEHVLNMAEMVVRPDFLQITSEVVASIEAHYGPCAVFEHGSICEDSATSCGTAHAHLHVVPLDASLTRLAATFDDSLVWQSCSFTELKAITSGSEYLFAADRFAGKNTSGCVTILQQGTSQFFRRVIAQYLGRYDEFSYKSHPQLDTALETMRRLKESSASFNKAA